MSKAIYGLDGGIRIIIFLVSVKTGFKKIEAGGMMRAIIETGGTQITVEENAKVKIPKLEIEVGKEVDFDKVLFVSAEDAPQNRQSLY